MLLAEIGGLITYVYIAKVAQPDKIVIAIYLGASAVPLICLGLMTRLRDRFGSRRSTYDRSTIMFIRWTLFLGLAMVAFLCCAWGSLPGQEPREITLPIVRTEVASWDKESTRTVKRDDRIIRAYASFSPSTYNVTLPKNVVIDSALANKGKVRDSWEIVGMTPWIGDTESKTSADHWQVPTGTAEEERYHQRLSLDNVDAKKQYTIRVVLRQKGSTICAEQMKALVRGNEGVQEGALEVKAYYVALASPKPSSSEMSESQKVNK